MEAKRDQSGLKVGIVVLTLMTALIHLYLNVVMGKFDLLFTLNGLGYLALLAALFLPLPVARDHRRLVRVALIAFTVVTIVAWIFLGRPYTPLGYFTKTVEVILVILLLLKRP